MNPGRAAGIFTQSRVVAAYVYDDFGNTISRAGSLADFFRHCFSTKYFDAETGLYYYGYRFYSPLIRRWMTKDPLGEDGGCNLYVFNSNNMLLNVDPLGLKVWSGIASTSCKGSDIDVAARNVLERAVQMTRTSKPMVEYYGNLCCKCEAGKARVIVTGPIGGRIEKKRRGRNVIQETAVSWPDDPAIKCPDGTQRVGYYHTHILGENFSKSDLGVLENRDHPYYLSQDGKRVKKAIPRRTDNPLQAGLHSSAKAPNGFPYLPYEIVIF